MTGLKVKGYIEINQELCKGCQLCIFFCPKKSITQSDKVNAGGYFAAQFSNDSSCTGCATCATVCPEAIIEVYRD
jgi:2-oxoglutarate ferredoxin oxidoreductase subunit delta